MVMIKKLFILIFFIIVIIILFLFLIPKLYHENLGEGPYFLYSGGYDAIQSKIDKKLYLADILFVKYNDQCIIALQANIRNEKKKYKYNQSNISFLVINKNTHKIFFSENLNPKKLLDKEKCTLYFSDQDISIALGKYHRRKNLYNWNDPKTLDTFLRAD